MHNVFAKARSNRLYALSPRCTPNSMFPVTAVQLCRHGCQYLLRLSPTHHAWVDTVDVELVTPYAGP
ncbi:hypothetical protein [Anthocerotibacter panamensis]|uniref:hypothetical protein n=1 Tax=Anthocerotibacter panamensis TaxID=2857077 RepID=UPI001C4034E4|nr:hypothetical protein [Anthocerotibacter panamensis]